MVYHYTGSGCKEFDSEYIGCRVYYFIVSIELGGYLGHIWGEQWRVRMIYPELTTPKLVPFNIILQQWGQDETFLSRKECPYTSEVKEFLLKLDPFREEVGMGEGSEGDAGGVTVTSSITTLQQIEEQLFTLLNDLTQYVAAHQKSFKPNEAMQAFKTRMALTDKLTIIQTRVAGLKEIHEFQEEILQIMDGVLLADQRTEVMEKLKLAIMGTVDMEALVNLDGGVEDE